MRAATGRRIASPATPAPTMAAADARRPPSLLLAHRAGARPHARLVQQQQQQQQQVLRHRRPEPRHASVADQSSSNNGHNGSNGNNGNGNGSESSSESGRALSPASAEREDAAVAVAVAVATEACAAAATKAADAAEGAVATAVAAAAGDLDADRQQQKQQKQQQHQHYQATAAPAAARPGAPPASSSSPSSSSSAAATTPTPPPQPAHTPVPDQSTRLGRLLHSPYDRELFALALPALLTMLLDPLMNVVDAAMVGHLGTQQLGAVSLGSLCVSFASFLFSFLLFLTTPRVAAANVRGDRAGVRMHASTGLWLAGVLGLLTSAALMAFAPGIVGALRPPEPAVAAFATDFIRVRAPGVAAALLSFVAAGTFRGLKDTRTPLVAAAVATTANLALNVVLIYGLGWGVVGSGLATTVAQATSCALLLVLLRRKGALPGFWEIVSAPPPLSEVAPLLKQGAVLSGRIVITFGVIMTGSALCVRQGAAAQAAFEVIRQLWLLTIQLFECLNVATQSMCASLLGAGDRAAARAVLRRSLGLSAAVAAAAGAAVWCLQTPLLRVFSSDPSVLGAAAAVLPLLCLFFPVDAVGSVMDGGFIAAGQPGLLSAIQVGGSLLQAGALAALAERSGGAASVLAVWSVLKILSVVRCAGGFAVHFGSRRLSAYMEPLEAPPPPPPAEGGGKAPLLPAAR